MRQFDGTLKVLIIDSASELLRQLGVAPGTEWLNVELPRVRHRRVDLLGRTPSGDIIHIELQSENDANMPLRMAEYALLILERYKRYPHQLVLYVGKPKMRMKSSLETHGMTFRYDQLDIRQLDGNKLMKSAQVSDNILALLTGLEDKNEVAYRALRKIGKLRKQSDRDVAMSQLLSAAELRDLQDTISEEVRKVPIILRTSINDKTFGPWIRKGIEKGREKGREEAKQEGLQKFRRTVHLQLTKRFGPLPVEIRKLVAKLSEPELEELALALIDAKSLDELFPAHSGNRQ